MRRPALSIVLAFGGLAAVRAAVKEGSVEGRAGDTAIADKESWLEPQSFLKQMLE